MELGTMIRFESGEAVTLPLGRGAKYGTMEVDLTRFNDEVNHFVYIYGLRQIINDAMATKVDSNDFPLSDAEIVAKAQKRLDNLYEGVIRTRGDSSEPADPVEALAWQEAKKSMEAKLRSADQWKDIPRGTRNRLMFVLNRARVAAGHPEIDEESAISTFLDKNPDIRADAKRTIAKREKRVMAAMDELF
jgi:hypothetical protein